MKSIRARHIGADWGLGSNGTVNALKALVLLQPEKILASSSIHKCLEPMLKAVRDLRTGLHKPVAN
jgi:hypothetical protein